jgi:acetylornithine deacetylase
MSAEELIAAVDERALVEMALEIVSIPSPTGSEWAMAEHMRDVFRDLGLQVQLQEIEEGRANVIGVLEGSGGGPTLMFNGHMDTSYSGEEPWLQGIPGFQPRGFLQDGHVYGLGI